MSNDLMMRLQLQLAEKVSGPLRKMHQASLANVKGVQALRDKLKELEKQNTLIQKMRQQETAFKNSSQQLKINRAQLESMKNSGVATAAQIQRQTTLVDKSSASFNRQGKQLTTLRALATNSGIKNLSAHEAQLGAQITKTTEKLNNQANALKRIDGIKATRDKQLGTLAKVGAAGLGMKMLGQRGLGAAKNFMMPGFQFDQDMAKVQALTGLSKDSEAFQALRQQARDLGAATNFNATDAAQGQAYLAMSGFKPEAIMAAMPGLLDMSLASGVDLGQTANIGSNILQGFGLDPTEMTRVGDVLTSAFTSSNTTLEELGNTMAYMAPMARAAGVGLEEAAAMAGLLANVGIKGSSSGTMLRTMLGKLADTGSKTLKGLGIKAADKQGDLRDISELLLEINKATEKMGSAERLTVLKDIFDTRGITGANELLEQVANGGLKELTDKLKNSQGAAKTAAETMNEHLGGKLKELESGWQEFGNKFYDGIKEHLSWVVVGLTEVIGKLNEWAKANPELAGTIAKVVIGGLAVITVLGTLMMAVAAILAPLVILKATLFILSLKVFGITGAIKGVATAFTLLKGAVIAHPIIALLVAIGFAAFAIYKNWGSIKWFFAELWDAVTGIFTRAVDSVLWLVGDLWDSVATFFNSGIANISATILNWSPLGLFYQAFAEVLSWFGVDMPATFSEFGSGLLDGLISGITGAMGRAKEAIQNIGDSVISWFRDKLNINSPSRVFMEAGLSIPHGAALGMLQGIPRVEAAANDMAFSTLSGGGSSPFLRAGGGSSGYTNNYAGDTVNIYIDGSTLNQQEIKDAVQAALDNHARNKMARSRSSYSDAA